MTLEYRSATHQPPCQRGLTVWGVLFLLASGVIGLGLVTSIFSVIMLMGRLTTLGALPAAPAGAPTSAPVAVAGTVATTAPATVVVTAPAIPTFDSKTMIIGLALAFAIYGVLAIFMGVLGVGMIRKRRWVRPWVLAGSSYLVVTCVAAIPTTALSVGYSQQASLTIMFPMVALLCLSVGIALMLFRYFRKPEMVETLNHFDPMPSRLDRWSVPVFSVAVIAIFSGIFGVFGLWGPAKDLANGSTAGGLLLLISHGLPTGLYFVGGVYCLFRPRLGWQILMTAVVVGLTLGVINTIFFRDAQIRALGLSGLSDPEQSLPPTWVFLFSVVSMLLAYAIALWIIRKPFLSPDPEIPLAQLAPQN